MTESPQHKPNCSSNIQCAVYHANGVCPGYMKCDCSPISHSESPPDNCKEKLSHLENFYQKRIRQERMTAIQEAIDLSDKIESQHQTEFNEWRAFKGFRNALRDLLHQ